jgi:hypothetical protein
VRIPDAKGIDRKISMQIPLDTSGEHEWEEPIDAGEEEEKSKSEPASGSSTAKPRAKRAATAEEPSPKARRVGLGPVLKRT